MTDSPTQGYDNPALSVNKADLYVPDGDTNGQANGHANGQANGHSNGAIGVSSLEVSENDSPNEWEQAQQTKRDREPLLFCKWITNRPRTWFGIFLGCHAFFIVITMVLAATGYDIIPIVFDRLPLNIRDNVDYLRGTAFDERDNTDKGLTTWLSGDTDYQPERSETMDIIELLFYYPLKDKNLFTKANLMAINETENKFVNEADIQAKFCKLENGVCMKPTSIIRFFDGTYAYVDSVFLDPGFDNVVDVIFKANYYNETKLALAYHLSKGAQISSTAVFSYATRSSVSIGFPLKGFNSTNDRSTEQHDNLKEFYQKKLIPDVGNPYYKNGVADMDFVYNSGEIIGLSILNQVIKDFMLIVLSLMFIVIFMCIQTQSLWVALFSILSIFTGFCGANLIYRVILQFRYFGIFHILSVFIILGIGADDVFVFYDTWKETAHHPYKSLTHRVSDCFRKAALAMLFTSLTTAIAFFVSATSPFLGVYSFGVFSGVLILVNYCTVITFLPCLVIVYHLYFEQYRCCCCCPKAIPITDPSTPSKSGISQKNIVVRFFAGPFFKFVSHKVARWFILLFHAVIIAVMIYYCTQLKVNEEQIKFMKEGTLTGKYLSKRTELFSTRRQENLKVFLVWGLKNQDLSSCHHTNASCTGSTVWDDSFSLDSPQAQTAFYDLCQDIKNLDSDTITKLNIARSQIDNKPIVSCFMSDMKEFYENTTYGYFPVNSTLASTLITNNNQVYTSALTANQVQESAFEISLSYFMYNGFDYTEIMKYLEDNRAFVGETETDYTKKVTTGAGPFSFKYFYGTKMRYASITIDTAIDGGNLGYPQGLPLRDEWEKWSKSKMQTLPDSLKNGFQSTPESGQGFNLWHWLAVQKVLVSSAVTGIAVGIAVALPILIIATMNMVVGLIATLIIGIITICVIGVIPAAGWKLGFLESLNLVLVVGLAVDYVVHLAEAYSRAPYPDRLRRCRCMLEELGISVLSGAITTLGSSVFLLFAQIIFFSQFGIFILSTIGFSILHALSLFSTLMALIGPEGDTGSIKCCRKK